MLEIGIATQLGFIMMVIGILCAARPYETAKWHKNDADFQEREHKRAQSHRKKKDRVAFDPSVLAVEREPSAVAVCMVRILGAVSLTLGTILTIWSIL